MSGSEAWYLDWQFWKIVLAANSLCGLLIFEVAWRKFRRMRRPDEAINALFPAYRRDDCPLW